MISPGGSDGPSWTVMIAIESTATVWSGRSGVAASTAADHERPEGVEMPAARFYQFRMTASRSCARR